MMIEPNQTHLGLEVASVCHSGLQASVDGGAKIKPPPHLPPAHSRQTPPSEPEYGAGSGAVSTLGRDWFQRLT